MKKKLLLFVLPFLLFSCVEVDPNALSKAGELLEGKHYLVPDEMGYFNIEFEPDDNQWYFDMSIQYGDRIISKRYPANTVIFTETTDKAHLKYRWKASGGCGCEDDLTIDKALNDYYIYALLALPEGTNGSFMGNSFSIKEEISMDPILIKKSDEKIPISK
jgi:hypothetical protein